MATTASFLMGEGYFQNPPRDAKIAVEGLGFPFINKTRNFDCRNSGTTLSLLLGIVREKCVLSGDQSLSSRSFAHQIHVLKECGFQFKFFNKENSLPFERPFFKAVAYFEKVIESAKQRQAGTAFNAEQIKG